MALWRVRVIWTGPSSPLLSTHYFDVGGGGTPQQAADAVATLWNALDNFVATGFTWATDTEVRQYNEVTGALQAVIPVTSASGLGSLAADRLDLLQGLVSWSTGDVENNRQVVGRTFIPGPTEGVNSSQGRPDGNYTENVRIATQALVNSANASLAVWHRPKFDPESGALIRDGSQHEVISSTVAGTWAFLSSRRS